VRHALENIGAGEHQRAKEAQAPAGEPRLATQGRVPGRVVERGAGIAGTMRAAASAAAGSVVVAIG
jgi:hypothetical protein